MPFSSPIGCGRNFTNPSGYIVSPNYPKQYDNNMNCTYLIEADRSNCVSVALSVLCPECPCIFVCLVNSFKTILNVTSSINLFPVSSLGLCMPYFGFGGACLYYESYYICTCNYSVVSVSSSRPLEDRILALFVPVPSLLPIQFLTQICHLVNTCCMTENTVVFSGGYVNKKEKHNK